VARSRKTPDKSQTPESGADQDDKVEDAVVVGETASDDAGVEPGAAAAPEGDAAPPEDGASVVDATDHSETPADEDQAAAKKLEDEQEPVEIAEPEPEAGASSVEAQDHTEETAASSEADAQGHPPEETAAEAARPAPPPPASSRGIGAGGIAALIFGGIVAGFIGLLASRYVFPDGWPGQGADTEVALAEVRASSEDLRATIEAQAARIADLQASVETLRGEVGAADPGVAALRDEISGEIGALDASLSEVRGQIGTLADGLGDLAGRVEQLELRPTPEALDTSSLDAELADFRAELSAAVDEARAQVADAQDEAAAIAAQAAEAAAAREAEAAAEADRLRAEAEGAAAAAERRAAAARIVSAVESGEPFEDALAALGETPGALSAYAETGVPTEAALQEAFPEAARDALDASIRAEAGDTAIDRFTAFVRVQSGARSLEPRAGDDPDAVLSRAEAALRDGDLAAALSELERLPEAGREELSGWIAQARARLEAEQAAADLAGSLNEN